jgi:hypothetical protein
MYVCVHRVILYTTHTYHPHTPYTLQRDTYDIWPCHYITLHYTALHYAGSPACCGDVRLFAKREGNKILQVCVCVCERESVNMCVRVEKECAKYVRECVRVYVCERERGYIPIVYTFHCITLHYTLHYTILHYTALPTLLRPILMASAHSLKYASGNTTATQHLHLHANPCTQTGR